MTSNNAVRVTAARIEETLGNSHAFTRVDRNFYVVHQGTAYICINILPWDPDRALVRQDRGQHHQGLLAGRVRRGPAGRAAVG